MRPEIYVKQGAVSVGTLQDNAKLLAGGGTYSLVVLSDGKVRAFGAYQLRKIATSATPVEVSGLADISAVAAGYAHSLAMTFSSKVKSWGENGKGQLGNGTPGSSAPRDVLESTEPLSKIKQVASGREHSLALRSDGAVLGWGDNSAGQLGALTSPSSAKPVLVQNGLPGDIVEITAGHYHNLAIDNVGQVWAWGKNDTGQVGDGKTSAWSRPVKVLPAADQGSVKFMAVAAGERFSLALDSAGQVWAWGSNAHGQLGVDVTVRQRSTPEKIAGLSPMKAIAAGAMHGLALKLDGTVLAWGQNYDNQLGAERTMRFSSKPLQVPDLQDIAAIGAHGGLHSLAVTAEGKVFSWGRNVDGQLGLGDTSPRVKPEPIASLNLPLSRRPAPDETTFSPEEVDTQGAPLEFSIENWGAGDLDLTGNPRVQVEGADKDDFTVTTQPESPIASGAKATFQVSFRPKKEGEKRAKLVIASNDLDDPKYGIAIKGTGISGERVQVTNAAGVSLTAGSIQPWETVAPGTSKKYTIKNIGQKDLTIKTITLSGGAFELSSAALPTKLAAGQTYDFSVTLRPTGGAGVHKAAVTIETDTAKTSSFSFNVEATSDNEPRIEVFGGSEAVVFGGASTWLNPRDGDERVYTIKNAGQGTLNVSNISVKADVFALVGGATSAALLPNQTHSFKMKFRFAYSLGFVGGGQVVIASDVRDYGSFTFTAVARDLAPIRVYGGNDIPADFHKHYNPGAGESFTLKSTMWYLSVEVRNESDAPIKCSLSVPTPPKHMNVILYNARSQNITLNPEEVHYVTFARKYGTSPSGLVYAKQPESIVVNIVTPYGVHNIPIQSVPYAYET